MATTFHLEEKYHKIRLSPLVKNHKVLWMMMTAAWLVLGWFGPLKPAQNRTRWPRNRNSSKRLEMPKNG